MEDIHKAKFMCRQGYRDHFHLTFTEVYGKLSPAEFPRQMDKNFLGKDGALRLGLVEWLAFPRALRMRRIIPLVGTSARIGEYLFQHRSEPWAKSFLENAGGHTDREVPCAWPGCEWLARPTNKYCSTHALEIVRTNRDFQREFPDVILSGD